MKIKEIRYISADSLQHLQNAVNSMLDAGWAIVSPVSFGHGVFIQEMGLPYKLAYYSNIVRNYDEINPTINEMLKEGYLASGHPFAFNGGICQCMLRWE